MKKLFPTYLILAMAAVGLVLPIRELMAWAKAPQVFHARLARLTAISSPGRHYIDALPVEKDRVAGVYLSPHDEFLCDIFLKKSDRWVLGAAAQNIPEVTTSTPFAPVGLRRGSETLVSKGDHLEWNRAPASLFPKDGSSAIDGEWGPSNIYYTRVVGGSYRVVGADPSGAETILPFPERRGHSYLPLRWESGRALFYQGVGYLDPAKKSDGFVHRLFILPDGGTLASLPLGLADRPERRAYSVSGSLDGEIFVHTSGFLPDHLFVYEKKAHPYPSAAASNQGGSLPYSMPKGLSLVAHPAIKYFHLARFSPEGNGAIYLVAAEGEGRELALWQARLVTQTLRVHPWGTPAIFAGISLALALFLVFLAFRRSRGDKTGML